MAIDIGHQTSHNTGTRAVDATRRDDIDRALRPQYLRDYIGQQSIKRNIKIVIDAAKSRGDVIDHMLFYGSAGLGKTTLSHIIAREMNVGITVTSGPAIERVGDLGALLTNLSDGDVLFIDEIHRLRKTVEEVLYPAMEDGVIDLIVGKGPGARSVQLELPRFTLIGATTQMGALSNPLRNRFGSVYRLAFYEEEEMEQIIARSARLLEVKMEAAAIRALSQRVRRTPRVANRLMRRVRDFAQAHNATSVTEDVVDAALELMEIDHSGLEAMDRALLSKIIDDFGGGPVGVKTLAAALGEEVYTLEEVYEPYLIQCGFLMRTPRGRVVLERAFSHLDKSIPPRYHEMRTRLRL